MRPKSIDISRTRSRSPSRMFMASSPRSNMNILHPRKSETKKLVEPIRNALHETMKLVEPIRNALHETTHINNKTTIKIVLNGKLIEPHSPPGPPPYLKTSIRRPMIKRQNNQI